MGAGWSQGGVAGVPLELVYRVLRHVSLRDLTTLSATCRYLRGLIQESPLLWSHVHTQELWPNDSTWKWFHRAATCGNVGASIKLAVAMLYNEGVVIGAKPVMNGDFAVSLFEKLETGGSLWPRSQLWLLYRPPWGAVLLCCKRYVHTRISHIAQMTGATWANRVLSRIAEVSGDADKTNDPTAINWVKIAAQGGDTHARLLQWQSRYEKRHREGHLDPGTELQASRELRELCQTGFYPACLKLALFLASTRHSLSPTHAAEVRDFFQASPPSRTWSALAYQHHVTPHMHHVLVDWLCEVANMKLHASKVFHAATQIVEAYLNVEQVRSHQLQLVGITAVLLATRFIPGASILTIREASWVTDSTYTYNHVVRTIGHIMAALQANLAFPTILDYACVLLESVRAGEVTQEWARFLCDLATTCSFPPRTTLAQIGCSCVFLGYLLSRAPVPWPNLPAITGFSQHQLIQPALIIYSKCFDLEGSKCQRQGIIERYSLPMNGGHVGSLPTLPLEDLLTTLGLSEADYLHLVSMTPGPVEDMGGTSEMETSGDGSMRARCNGFVYKSCGEQNIPKMSKPCVGVCMEDSLEVPGAMGIDVDKMDDGKMECSDNEIVDDENSKCHSERVETKNRGLDNEVCLEQASGEVRSPQELQESVSETTSSEENSELLSQTCEDGELVARVSLKRKLENAAATERPEKCLILDVGNLQLD